jgi:hypothetical protein
VDRTKAKSLDQALSKVKTITVRPTAKKTWKIKVKGLTRGTLYAFYVAVDKDDNRSEVKDKTQKLTR